MTSNFKRNFREGDWANIGGFVREVRDGVHADVLNECGAWWGQGSIEYSELAYKESQSCDDYIAGLPNKEDGIVGEIDINTYCYKPDSAKCNMKNYKEWYNKRKEENDK